MEDIEKFVNIAIKKSKKTRRYSTLYTNILNDLMKQELAINKARLNIKLDAPEAYKAFDKLIIIKFVSKMVDNLGGLREYKDIIMEEFIRSIFDKNTITTRKAHNEILKRMLEGMR